MLQPPSVLLESLEGEEVRTASHDGSIVRSDTLVIQRAAEWTYWRRGE